MLEISGGSACIGGSAGKVEDAGNLHVDVGMLAGGGNCSEPFAADLSVLHTGAVGVIDHDFEIRVVGGELEGVLVLIEGDEQIGDDAVLLQE